MIHPFECPECGFLWVYYSFDAAADTWEADDTLCICQSKVFGGERCRGYLRPTDSWPELEAAHAVGGAEAVDGLVMARPKHLRVPRRRR